MIKCKKSIPGFIVWPSLGFSKMICSILGAGTSSNILLKLAVCWLKEEGLSENFEKGPFENFR